MKRTSTALLATLLLMASATSSFAQPRDPGIDARPPTPKDALTPNPDSVSPSQRDDTGVPRLPDQTQASTSDVSTPSSADAELPSRRDTMSSPKPGPTKVSKKELEQLLQATLEQWERIRGQHIPVINIQNASVDDPLRKALTIRYKALFAKRRSNRRWYRYWQSEERLSSRVERLFSQLTTVLREELTALRGRKTRAETDLAGQIKAQAAATADAKAALEQIAKRLALLKIDIAEHQAALKKLPTEERRLKRNEAQTRKGNERALKGDDKEAQKKAAEEWKKAIDELQRLVTRKLALEASLKLLEAAHSSCESWNQARQGPTSSISDKPCRLAAERWVERTKRLAALLKARASLAATIEGTKRAIGQTGSTIAVLDRRRASLLRWSKLAHDKTVNQDRYLEAISQDLKAVRRRLNSLALEQNRQKAKPKSRKPESPKVNGRSPYAVYKARLSHILGDKARFEERLRDVKANHQLVTAQLQSLEILSKAQSTDVKLLHRERLVARREIWRIENEPLERAALSLAVLRGIDWRAIWKRYETNADGKREKLSSALRDTQSSIDSMHSDASVFVFEEKDLERSIGRLTKEAAALEAQRTSYLWRSALYWLRANAWQIPLYLLGAWLLLWITRRIGESVIARAKTRRTFIEDRDAMQQLETLVRVMRGVARLVIYLAALLGIVASLGVNISPILGAGAIFGLAISFGSQNLVRDVVTGFFILLENQYAVGDVITVGSVTGVVEQITLRRTVVRGLDGTVHNIPNGSVSLVSNKTQGWSRALVHVGVGYESDLALVEEVSNRVGQSIWDDEKFRPWLLEAAPKYIGLTELGDSALVVRVMGKTITGQQWDVERELMKRLKEAYDAAGINIPFPQRDLHIKMVPEAKVFEAVKRNEDRGPSAGGDGG